MNSRPLTGRLSKQESLQIDATQGFPWRQGCEGAGLPGSDVMLSMIGASS